MTKSLAEFAARTPRKSQIIFLTTCASEKYFSAASVSEGRAQSAVILSCAKSKILRKIKKKKAAFPAAFFISREPICKPGSVLTVIYLGAPLPVRSSHPGDGRASRMSPYRCCSG